MVTAVVFLAVAVVLFSLSLMSIDAFSVRSNAYGGSYVSGRAYPIEKKVEVANEFYRLEHQFGVPPTPDILAAATRVGTTFASKVMYEIETYGCVRDPKSIPSNRPRGVGSKTFFPDEEAYLLHLCREKPGRTLQDYIQHLQEYSGLRVSEGLLSTWFKKRGPFNGSKRKTSKVPVDKWSEQNTIRYVKYLSTVVNLDPKRMKFGDEKPLKGEDFFDQEVRGDMEDGTLPPIICDPDFRNTYSIMGIIQAGDLTQPALAYTIGEENGDSESWLTLCIDCAATDFFNRFDILVLDNCKIHQHGLCDILEDFLWNVSGPDGEPLNVWILWLPTRSPELNPIERIWNVLVSRLKARDLTDPSRPRQNAVAKISGEILNGIALDHDLVKTEYIDCGYFRNW